MALRNFVEGARVGKELAARSRRWNLAAPLGYLDAVDCHFAAAAVLRSVKGNFLTFCKTANSGALKGGRVNEHVLAAVFRLNEAEALRAVVEFHNARNHWIALRSFRQQRVS